MGRVRYTAKNIVFGYISNLTYLVLGFALRTVFLDRIGETLIGVNGLYTGILSVVSLAELGIGTAMNYSLYEPVAREDTERIQAYLRFYRKAYRVIAAVVAGIGLAVVPFLPRLVKNSIGLTGRELTVYYLIFLFNTVSTYFMAYKYSLVNAKQMNYIEVNAATVSKILTAAVQMVVLLTTADFLSYLLAATVVELLQKLVMNAYLNRKYPFLREKNGRRLTREETGKIAADTRALAIQKVGDAARLQTDTIIISSALNVTLVGLLDNYKMIIAAVTGFVDIVFNAAIAGFGNLIATESKERQYALFHVYRFTAAWLYGFSALGFWYLLSPLVGIAWGSGRVIGFSVVFCIVLDYYLKGERIVLYNFKTAAGIFREDKYLAFAQGIVNLILSLFLVGKIGMLGVYVGTVLSGWMANLIRPFLIYRICFARSPAVYFRDTLLYLLELGAAAALLWPVGRVLLSGGGWGGLFAMAAAVTLVFNGLFLLCFHRRPELAYLLQLVRSRRRHG